MGSPIVETFGVANTPLHRLILSRIPNLFIVREDLDDVKEYDKKITDSNIFIFSLKKTRDCTKFQCLLVSVLSTVMCMFVHVIQSDRQKDVFTEIKQRAWSRGGAYLDEMILSFLFLKAFDDI